LLILVRIVTRWGISVNKGYMATVLQPSSCYASIDDDFYDTFGSISDEAESDDDCWDDNDFVFEVDLFEFHYEDYAILLDQYYHSSSSPNFPGTMCYQDTSHNCAEAPQNKEIHRPSSKPLTSAVFAHTPSRVYNVLDRRHYMMTLRSLLASSDVLLQTQFTLLTTGPLPPKSSRSLLPNRRTSTYVSNMVTETNLSQLVIPSPSATPVFYMDTACSTSIVPVVTEVHAAQALETPLSVFAFSGVGAPVTHSGTTILGLPCLVVPESTTRLLSLSNVVDQGYSFVGDATGIRIFSTSGEAIIIGTRDESGLFICPAIAPQHLALNTVAHFTAEQRRRAQEAVHLHNLLLHPSDRVLVDALNNGNLLGCHLTAQDIRNARTLFGPCHGCITGKMTTAVAPTSLTEPAAFVGQHLHIDFIILEGRSIGGNYLVLTGIDEQSGYRVGIPTATKKRLPTLASLRSLISAFTKYNHSVKHITTDHERIFVSLQTDLASYGVRLTHTIPGRHESRVERSI